MGSEMCIRDRLITFMWSLSMPTCLSEAHLDIAVVVVILKELPVSLLDWVDQSPIAAAALDLDGIDHAAV